MANVRDRIQGIIARHVSNAVNEAIDVYRRSLDIDGGAAASARGPRKAPTAVAAKPGPKAKAKAKARGRVRRSPTQIQATLDRVIAFVDKHPGLTSEKIVKEMGGDRKSISDALARLRAEKKVKTTGVKRRMTYAL